MTGNINPKSVLRISVIIWEIPNYDKLESGRLYCQKYVTLGISCVYMFIRARNCLYIAIQCPRVKSNGQFYLISDSLVHRPTETLRFEGQFYIGIFPDNPILKSDDSCRNSGLLTVCFRFLRDFISETVYYPYEEVGNLHNSLEKRWSGTKRTYLESIDTDFTICAGNVRMQTHKCVLQAFSRFFCNFFDKVDAKEFTTKDIRPEIMHCVLMYLYSGELSELQAWTMAEVYSAAYLLIIPSLREKCRIYFEKHPWYYRYLDPIHFYQYELYDIPSESKPTESF